MVSSQDCERLHSWVCVFLSNHFCGCSSFSNSLSSSVHVFHSSTFNRILVLVLALVLGPVQCCPCFPLPCACAMLAFALFCPCLCQMHQCPLGRLLLDVMDLSVSRFVHLRTSTLTVCFDFFSQDTIRSQLARFNCTCFSRSYGNKASKELMRMSFRKIVCTFPLASRRPQYRLTRSSIFSMAPINTGNFICVGDRISLKRLRARPAVYGSHLPCSLRQLSKPWSPPADMTMSKLSQHHEELSVYLRRRLNSELRHANRNCRCCDHVLRPCCKRQSSTHSIAAAKLALHLSIVIESVRTPEPRVQVSEDRFQIVTSRHDQQPRTICGFGMTPVTSSSLVPYVNQQRVSHSFRRASRSFQIHNPRVSHSCRRAFALAPDRNHRAQRAPQQGAEEKNSSALRFHVCRVSALCLARNFRSRFEPDTGLCARMDERTCIRVITVDVTV